MRILQTRIKRLIGAGSLALSIVGCGKSGGGSAGPPLRSHLEFNDESFEQVAGSSRDGISQATYVHSQETLATARVQIGVLASYRYRSAGDLNRWVMDEYHK